MRGKHVGGEACSVPLFTPAGSNRFLSERCAARLGEARCDAEARERRCSCPGARIRYAEYAGGKESNSAPRRPTRVYRITTEGLVELAWGGLRWCALERASAGHVRRSGV